MEFGDGLEVVVHVYLDCQDGVAEVDHLSNRKWTADHLRLFLRTTAGQVVKIQLFCPARLAERSLWGCSTKDLHLGTLLIASL